METFSICCTMMGCAIVICYVLLDIGNRIGDVAQFLSEIRDKIK